MNAGILLLNSMPVFELRFVFINAEFTKEKNRCGSDVIFVCGNKIDYASVDNALSSAAYASRTHTTIDILVMEINFEPRKLFFLIL